MSAHNFKELFTNRNEPEYALAHMRNFAKELSEVDRAGIKDLLDELARGGFFTAPCSTKYHYARKYGLLDHSLNVLNIARRLHDGALAYDTPIPKDSITLAALLHDIGKMGQFGKEQYEKSFSSKKTAPYVYNDKLISVPHEIRSVVIASKYIDLTEEEQAAILYHNGMYTKSGKNICGHETPLVLLIHWADMWASRIVENSNSIYSYDS